MYDDSVQLAGGVPANPQGPMEASMTELDRKQLEQGWQCALEQHRQFTDQQRRERVYNPKRREGWTD